MKKEREIDKDTVVAYHTRVQNQIKDDLNGLNLGPGRFPMLLASIFYLGGLALGIIGVLVITLRHRHVYLISWNDQFLGPAFIVLFILSVGMGTYMVVLALRRTNEYRRGLVFRPIGDYGVAVTHKSRLNYEHETKEQLKSGTTPHDNVKPLTTYSAKKDRYGRPYNDGYDNRGYKDDPRGPPPRYSEKPRDDRRGPPRDRYRDDGPDRSREDRPRGPPGNRYRDDRLRPPGPDDRRRGPPGDRYGDDRDRRGPPRGPPRGPRDPRDPDRRGPPRGPPRDPRDPDRRRDPRDDDRRRQEDRRRYEEERERRRRQKEAEAGDPLIEKPPLPMPGPRPPVAPTETVVFNDNADISSESIL